VPTTVLEIPPQQAHHPVSATQPAHDLDQIVAKDARSGMQTYGRQKVAFVRGQGARLWDAAGVEYLDFLGGLAVLPLGHCHPRVTEAIKHQAETLIHSSNLYYIEPQADLADRLSELSNGMRAFFCNSGAEANEAAIKLARKYAKQAHGAERFEVITAIDGFHGRTYGSLAATGQPKYHEGFEPMPGGFLYVPINDIAALEAALTQHTAAILLEPIQGESGIRPCTDEYLRAVRDLCDRHGIVLIFDEVQTGMGRTGRFFAHEWSGVKPDIITMAKGLANGVPIGSVLATPEVAAAFVPGNHGCTFGGNFLSCAAAVATINALYEEDLLANATAVGAYFTAQLQAWGEKTGIVEEVRGRGLMIGVLLNQPIARALMLAAMDAGLVFNAVGDNVLRFLPPLNIGRGEVDEAIEKLHAAYLAVKS